MLAYITNRHEILQLKLGRVDSSRATVFARFYDSTEVTFQFIVELPGSVERMLAELLADGYDLSLLGPFLGG